MEDNYLIAGIFGIIVGFFMIVMVVPIHIFNGKLINRVASDEWYLRKYIHEDYNSECNFVFKFDREKDDDDMDDDPENFIRGYATDQNLILNTHEEMFDGDGERDDD